MTRPTADRARQALFNVLEHAPWSPGLAGRRALDLFAGSGALGLEALSRGAAFCLFVETAPAAVAAIEANVAGLGLADRTIVRRWDATRLPPAPASPDAGGAGFDLAFMDPPYGAGLVAPTLAALAAGGWLATGAVLAVERGADEARPDAPDFHTLDDRVWGAARVWFLRFPRR